MKKTQGRIDVNTLIPSDISTMTTVDKIITKYILLSKKSIKKSLKFYSGSPNLILIIWKTTLSILQYKQKKNLYEQIKIQSSILITTQY